MGCARSSDRHDKPAPRAVLLLVAGPRPGLEHAHVRGATRALPGRDLRQARDGVGSAKRLTVRTGPCRSGGDEVERTRNQMTFGFPRMHKEGGELRDFLPPLVHQIAELGCPVFVESGIGSGMGFADRDYATAGVQMVDEHMAYEQDVVLVLRAPTGKFEDLRPGATLISMLHFPTRPARVRHLERLGLRAIGLDTIEDDEGRRLVVNGKAVAWNGLEAAFAQLERTWPAIEDRRRRPIRVTVMGAGDIGKHAVEASTKFGSLERNDRFASLGLPGVEVATIGRKLTSNA